MSSNQQVSPELLAAYQQTTYRCDDYGLKMEIGQLNTAADNFMDERGAHKLTVITGWNPRSVLLDDSDNHAWNQQLRLKIEQLQKPFWEGENRALDDSWPPEDTFWVANLSSYERDQLAEEYGQNAVVEISKGGVAELVLIAVNAEQVAD